MNPNLKTCECGAVFYATKSDRVHCSEDCRSRTRLKAQPEES